MPNDLSEPYRILGLQPGVSAKEIKRAYRDLAKVWHPDRFTHDPRLQARAQEQLKMINKAYEQLRSYRLTRPRQTRSQSRDDSAGASRTRETQSSPADAERTHAPLDVPAAQRAESHISTWLIAALLLAGNSNRTQRQRLEIWLFRRLL
jgi:hypothetical protein